MVYKLFSSTRIYTGEDDVPFAGGILVHSGKIRRIVRSEDELLDSNIRYEKIDFGDLVLMPGLVDSHVHINEPGRTQWEGFATATKAAAAGGFTTIVDMPLNSIPPTTTVENLNVKAKVAKQKTFVDLGFWGGVVPGNDKDLKEMVRHGVVGFKCFLCPSGVPEFEAVSEADVDKALEQLKGTGSVLAFHAEMDMEGCCGNDVAAADPKEYSTYLNSRPKEMEMDGIRLVIRQAEKHKARVHIVHLATADAIPMIQETRAKGTAISVETCHHYLSLNSSQIPDGGTEYKCAPPIRDANNQKGLWDGVLKGDINLIVSDHSPSTPDVKLLLDTLVDKGNFLAAWGGIASVQLGLSLFWTNGKERGVTIPKVIQLMSHGPAQLCGFQERKGALKVGYDADFVVWSPEDYFNVADYLIQFKNKANPYTGRYLQGVVYHTILRGEPIFDRFNPAIGGEPTGELLLRHSF